MAAEKRMNSCFFWQMDTDLICLTTAFTRLHFKCKRRGWKIVQCIQLSLEQIESAKKKGILIASYFCRLTLKMLMPCHPTPILCYGYYMCVKEQWSLQVFLSVFTMSWSHTVNSSRMSRNGTDKARRVMQSCVLFWTAARCFCDLVCSSPALCVRKAHSFTVEEWHKAARPRR